MAGPKQLQNLDVSNRRINSSNVPLEVALLDASGNQVASFGGGTQYTEGDSDATITGTALLFEIDSTANTVGVPSSTRGLPVNIVAGSAAGTEYTDGNSTISGPNQTFRDSSGAVRGVASTRGLPVAIVAGSAAGTEYTDADSTIAGPNQTFRDSSGAVRGVASTRGLPVAIVAGSAAGTEYTDGDSTISGPNLTYRDSSGAVRGVTSTRGLPVANVDGSALNVFGGPVIVRSTAAEALVTVYQSSIADLKASVQQNSTVWAVQIPSTQSIQVKNSTAGDLLATVSGVVRSTNSVAADLLATVSGVVRSTNSVAADFLATVSGTVRSTNSVPGDLVVTFPSTQSVQVKNSTIGGLLASVQQNSTVWAVQIPSTQSVQVKNSTIGDLLASVQQNSTTWAVQMSSGVVNVSGFGGNAVVTGRGAAGSGIPRVTASEEATTISFTLNSAGQATAMETDTQIALAGYHGISWVVAAGTLAATVVPEMSVDGGTTWDAVIESRSGIVRSEAAGIAYTNPNGREPADVFLSQGTTHFRLRCSAYTSGSAVFAITVNKVMSPLALGGLAQSVPFLAPSVWANYTAGKDGSGLTTPLELRSTNVGANVPGLVVRQAYPDLQSTCFSTLGNNSTSSTIVSSAAGVRHKVYAFAITSTMNGGAANTITFASSLGSPIWHGVMRAISSGITGIQQAVTPPAWLFATAVANPLVFKVTGSTGSYHVSFSYFSEA
jgi:hypothetical protein